jgi:hypothetical protein
MNNWLIFAIALAATAGLLLATVAAGAYGKGPAYKPYWEDPNKRNAILAEASSVGILAQRGPQGVVVVGYRDQLNATYRTELLSVLSQLLKAAEGYTVYLAPWATDNATRSYLALLYNGQLTLGDYLQGKVVSGTATSPKIDQAWRLANMTAEAYGSYQPLGTRPVFQTPPIYVAIFRNDTTYVAYEPFTLGRDKSFTDWFQWVKTALENLKSGQGKVTP